MSYNDSIDSENFKEIHVGNAADVSISLMNVELTKYIDDLI